MGYWVYQRALYQAQEKMESDFLKSLPESELEEINYTDNQAVIYWQEDDEDFIFNSRLYDVAKKKTINGIVYLYCIKEEKEISLLEHISKTSSVNKSNDINIGNPDPLTEYILKHREALQLYIFCNSKFSITNTGIPEWAKEIILPPPRPFCLKA